MTLILYFFVFARYFFSLFILLSAFLLHWRVPVHFEQSNFSMRRPSIDVTLSKATYAWPAANNFEPKYTTAWSTVLPCILCTVQAQHSTIDNILRSAVPWLYFAGNCTDFGWIPFLSKSIRTAKHPSGFDFGVFRLLDRLQTNAQKINQQSHQITQVMVYLLCMLLLLNVKEFSGLEPNLDVASSSCWTHQPSIISERVCKISSPYCRPLRSSLVWSQLWRWQQFHGGPTNCHPNRCAKFHVPTVNRWGVPSSGANPGSSITSCLS